MYTECKDFYQRIEYFVKHNRSDKDRRQHYGPPPGDEQRHGSERRKDRSLNAEAANNCQFSQTQKTPLADFIGACCSAIPPDDDLIVTIHVSRKKP